MARRATRVENYGTGRRKNAIARVWITPGEGNIKINGRDFKEYLGRPVLEILVQSPFEVLNLTGRYNVNATTNGGGITGQAGAICQGVARALKAMYGLTTPAAAADGQEAGEAPVSDLAKKLRDSGYLTRDGRMKERKKYGRKGARKSFQFSKR